MSVRVVTALAHILHIMCDTKLSCICHEAQSLHLSRNVSIVRYWEGDQQSRSAEESPNWKAERKPAGVMRVLSNLQTVTQLQRRDPI